MPCRHYKPILLVAVAVVIIGLYLAGLIAALFGPWSAHWLGLPAFLATFVFLIAVDEQRRRGTLQYLAQRHSAISQTRPIFWILMLVCGITAAASLVVLMWTSGNAGVAAGEGPVFAVRPEYQLNSHGDYTTVSRTRYLLVGTSFLLGWHTFGMLFGLHMLLYGEWPPGFKQ